MFTTVLLGLQNLQGLRTILTKRTSRKIAKHVSIIEIRFKKVPDNIWLNIMDTFLVPVAYKLIHMDFYYLNNKNPFLFH